MDNGVVNGSIVLALDLMNDFEMDLQNQVVHAGTGAIWHAIDGELKKSGWELAAPGGDMHSAAALASGADEALGVVEDVRDLAQGIHPAVLTQAGLPAALRALANRSPVPVVLDVAIERNVSGSAAAAAYFVVSEALANVVKHAGASRVRRDSRRRTVDRRPIAELSVAVVAPALASTTG